MKLTKSHLTSLLLALTVITGVGACSTIDDGSYVEPIRLYEKIEGKWVLNSLIQTDETNAKNMTLTNELNFDTFVLSLNRDQNGQPTTFSVEGTAPELLPLQGVWTLDNPFTKSDGTAVQLLLKGKGDSQWLTITTVSGNSQTLEFKLLRTVSGKPFVSYTYNLMQSEKYSKPNCNEKEPYISAIALCVAIAYGCFGRNEGGNTQMLDRASSVYG